MKISAIGKGIAIAGAVGLTALAYTKGKKNLAENDQFVNSKVIKQTGMAIKDGYQTLGKGIVKTVKEIPGKAKEAFEGIKGKFAKTEEVAKEVVEETTEKVAE